MKTVLLLLSIVTFSANSLEIDEKLTLRIVGTSETRKTVLINRGDEDGLLKGDHAKFYVSLGVVARGVCIKVSPGRSVWSLYRLVNADYIRKNEVMKLKITAPVKITKDESRTLVSDDTASSLVSEDPRDLGIPLADGADDLKGTSASEKMGDGSSRLNEVDIYLTDYRQKNRELFGNITFSSRSSSATNSSTADTFSASEMNFILDSGVEYYFQDEMKWYSRLSVIGTFRFQRQTVMALEGTSVSENSASFGIGTNWYPLTRPFKAYKFIPFGHFSLYLGSTQSAVNIGDSGGNLTPEDVAGSFMSYVFGGGVKYFMHNSFGASLRLDYEFRSDTFGEDSFRQTRSKSGSGPRVFTGLLYRF